MNGYERRSRTANNQDDDSRVVSLDTDPLCQCQGCGAWRGIAWLGRGHACWRNEDGTYEEGGTFQ